MDTWQRILKRRDEVVARQVAGETLLIPVKGKLADMQRVFALDPVAEQIWNALDGGATLEDVLRRVIAVFDVEEPVARRDVLAFVTSLEAAGLVEAAGGLEPEGTGR